jgi:hypothetical protein
MNEKLQKVKTLFSLTTTPVDAAMEALRANPQICRLIDREPGFISMMKAEFYDAAAPLYVDAPDEVIDAAIAYYGSFQGDAFQKFQGGIQSQLAGVLEAWGKTLEAKLGALLAKRKK